MRYFLLVILFILIFSSCKKSEHDCYVFSGIQIQCKTYSKDGSLRNIATFLKDTITKSGPYFEFSSKGDTIKKAYFKKDKLVGNYYEFYSNGQPKKYFCFDSFHEDTMYCRVYDSSGYILSEWDSNALFYNRSYTVPKTITLNKDSVFEIWSIVLQPPKSKFSVYCRMVKFPSNDSVFPSKSYFIPNQNDLIYSTVFKIHEPGKYNVYVYTSLIDSLKHESLNKVERFTFSFPM